MSKFLREMNNETQNKWNQIAIRCAAVSFAEIGSNGGMTKETVWGHMEIAFDDLGYTWSNRKKSNLRKMQEASITSGPETPSLDLVTADGVEYVWLRDGSIPAGYICFMMKIIGGFPRIAFNHFNLIGHGVWTMNEFVDRLGPAAAMLSILMAEVYVRIVMSNQWTTTELTPYLELMTEFKTDLQSKLSRQQVDDFNLLGSQLLLANGVQ